MNMAKGFAVVGLLGVAVVTQAAQLTLTSNDFKDHEWLPYKFGYCQPNGKGEAKASGDISPQLMWSGAPKATKSFAMVMTDPDIPNVPNFNVPGTLILQDAKRITGFHWVMANIPSNKSSLPQGAGSRGFVKGGKKPGQTPYGLTGINVYNAAFKSPMAPRINFHHMTKAQLDGTYGDYDGPCAAWNDMAIHHYTFTVYALDVKTLDLPSSGQFQNSQVMTAMKGHILAKAVLVGNFTTNPKLLPS